MKSRIALAAVCLLSGGLASAQTLQVIAPTAGQGWELGSKQKIGWQATYLRSGQLASHGRVLLERNGETLGTISSDVVLWAGNLSGTNPPPGVVVNHYLEWVVGKYTHSGPVVVVLGTPTPVTGGGYRIRIVSRDGQYPDAFSGVFSITPATATDSPGSQIVIRPGDCVISAFTARAVPHDPASVMVAVEVQNLRRSPSAGLQLHLVRNHVEFRVERIPQMAARTRWHTAFKDPAPAPGHTNNYVAILSTGNPITEPQSVLDRKTASFRRSQVITGHP